jgi:hypothetical protein
LDLPVSTNCLGWQSAHRQIVRLQLAPERGNVFYGQFVHETECGRATLRLI